MNDLIERQIAIDALNEYFARIEKLKRVRLREKAISLDTVGIINTLPSAQPEQRWIPVSKWLPKEKDAGILKKLGVEKKSEYVLATVEVKGERIVAIVCTYDGKWHWKMRYAFPDFKVIAWKPLPEPYKEEKKK